jgi:toluene monooxygenase system protein E
MSAPRKTYSRLENGRRMPSQYEIVSADLHYNHPHGFELDTAVARWYADHREGSRLQARDWEAFSDPRRTTYRMYNQLRDQREAAVDGLLDEIDSTDYDLQLDAEWVGFLHDCYFPLRFAAHGLEMLAAYVGQMAPASRITNCAAFQAGDELRRLQRIAYRTAQLGAHRPGPDSASHRRAWEEAEWFQPLRELVERALVTYDWGESFVLLDLVIKPRLDRLVNGELGGGLARGNGDPLLGSIHASLDHDSAWHREWSATLLRTAVKDTPANAATIDGWAARWTPLASDATHALAAAFARAPHPADGGLAATRIDALAAAELAEAIGAIARS